MRLLLDESISHRIAEPLRAAGHDVVHVEDLSMLGVSDLAVLERAAAEDRTVVTADTDFGTLLALSGAALPASSSSAASPIGRNSNCSSCWRRPTSLRNRAARVASSR